jgi:hypothetical protein
VQQIKSFDSLPYGESHASDLSGPCHRRVQNALVPHAYDTHANGALSESDRPQAPL